MAIVKMNKLSVIGMNDEKPKLLKELMNLGVVEVSSQVDKLQDEKWRELVIKDGDEENVSENDRQLAQIDAALKIIEQYGKVKKPLFSMRRVITVNESKSLEKKEKTYAKEVDEVIDLSDQLSDAFAEENSLNAEIAALQPWLKYGLPLDENETARLNISLGVLPAGTDITKMSEELAGEGCDSEITELGRDKLQCYVSAFYFKDDEEKFNNVVKKHGYSNAPIAHHEGTVEENLTAMKAELEELASKKDALKEEIASKVSYKEDIEFYHDMIVVRRDEGRIRGNLLKTEKTFTFDGWVPETKDEEVKKLLDTFTCSYDFTEAAEDDDVPVKLKNNSFVHPVEFITKMYSLPNSKEVDPTAIFTLFYILFFGIMFADIGYGIILFAATFFAKKKFHLEGSTGELMTLLSYCGVSSAIWGVMFGGFFGDFLTVFSQKFLGSTITIKPLWLDPVNSSMTFLVFACGFGVVHLFVGMGIKAYEQIKKGEVLEAINDNFLWYLIVLGIILWLFGSKVSANAPMIGKWMAIIGFAGAIILPIFINKGVGKALGLWNIYSGVTGNLSDILSYSRLLGLGLASTSIATVINFLATLGGDGFAGIAMFILVELIGHVFNFAINALGAFVHSCRLQYVEFFGKFFEGGGREFEPFREETKYVRIIEEGK